MRFGVHTLVDAALGIGLLIAGIHGHGDDYLILDAAGAYLLLVTLLTDSAGGLWKLIRRLAHRLLDGAVSLALIASPVIAWKCGVHLDAFATGIAEVVGGIVLRDAIVTDHRVLPRASRSVGSGTRQVIDARALEAGVSEAARRAGEVAGKLAGRTSGKVRKRAIDR
jgi:hypothetical protein